MTNGFFTRENTCPTCNYLTDTAVTPDGTPVMPEPGDVSVCIQCGEILQFDRSMKLHKISDAQLNEIQSVDPHVYFDAIQAQALARVMKRLYNSTT